MPKLKDQIYTLVGCVLCHINPCQLFNDKSCLNSHTHTHIHTHTHTYIYDLFTNSLSVAFLNELELICLHILKWFQVFLQNTINSSQYYSFVCKQLNGFKYCNEVLIIQFSISHGTLASTTIPVQNGRGSNGNQGVLRIAQSSRSGASPSNVLLSYPGYSLLFCRDAVGVIYFPSCTGLIKCIVASIL